MGTIVAIPETLEEIEERRREVAQALLSIRSMYRGTITEQYLRRKREGKEDAVFGPYPVLSRREGKRTRSKRLTTPEAVQQARQGVANHDRFKNLCAELAALTERLGELERTQQEQLAAHKKKPKRP